ncbi:MAG: NAD(P)/FAD-dependent oxidoreductase [Bacteroidetes bacterium]|nr:NAD(P)/FAD-dependent oxidoreductase [Bacteroidota bacterium]
MSSSTNFSAVTIIGAGPGGAAAALQLAKHNIACTIIDKAVFPRDKICGDGLTPKVATLLTRINPDLFKRFATSSIQTPIKSLRLVAPNNKDVYIPITEKEDGFSGSYASKRLDFDNFLVEEVKKNPLINLVEGVGIEKFEQINSGYKIGNKNGSFQLSTSLLLVADGAHSHFARHVAGINVEPENHAAAIRIYYKNIKPINDNESLEIIYLKELPLGYFWIFPLPDGYYNVGLGMRSTEVSKYKVNLKKEIQNLIANHPLLKDRFKDAIAMDKPSGFGLPLGGKTRPVSGANYMLIGDAACMIDPFTGEGVGNAIHAGMMAADQAKNCIETNDFSAQFLKAYDKRIHRVLGKDFIMSKRAQESLKYPAIFNLCFGLLKRNKSFKEIVTLALNGGDFNSLLKSPKFYLKLVKDSF